MNDKMKHLEVINAPEALNNKTLTHRNIDFLVFEYDSNKRECAIYENDIEWHDNTPAYTFTDVVKITCFNDNKED